MNITVVSAWMAKSNKYKRKPRIGGDPGGPVPRRRENPESYDQLKVSWGVTFLDRNGPWGFDSVDKSTLWNQIYPKLRAFESMTWSEIKRAKKQNHSVQVSKLDKLAQKRMIDLGLGEFDELFSLRLSSRERLFGILAGGILMVIWYDPRHEVCPVKKRHT